MILERPYNKETFDKFLKDFLPDFSKDERPVRTPDKSILTEVTLLGTSKESSVTVLEAECEETDSKKRIAITQAAFKVLRDHSIRNALIAFHDGADQWRLSLLTSTLELKDGKVIKKDSNPRRYSYLLGIGAKTRTPHKYLVEKGRVTDIKSLQERFSVEVVNKQFYESIADLFTKLVGGERGRTRYPGLLKISGQSNQNNEHQEFAVRLIGRIIFSWFLKEKKSAAGVPIVPDELLSLSAVASHSDYYHSILEPLFFELLNKRVNNRHEALRQAPFATVPYLNGGLFSPQNDDYYQQNSFTGGGNPGIVSISDSWFAELFTVLEQYNFTVDENTSYDVDLSIDPEMLGRIFENLLAEINPETGESARKSTGSFYTPREIVDYMVDSSLLEYLKAKTGIDEQKLHAIISWGQEDDAEHPLSSDEKKRIVDTLATLTILDPACGSGAFPIGILQKVVYILQQVDETAEIWLENQLKYVHSPELRRDIEEKYKSENYDWLRKLGVIRESIFGVDIQTIATEIAKLRCFLTLVIEEEVDDKKDNRGIRPLPNLDFKFVTANSLVGLPESNNKKSQPTGALNMFEDISHISRLKEIRNQYFGADADERARLQVEFKDLQLSMFKSRIASSGATSDLYNVLSDWNPFTHEQTQWFDSEWMFGIDNFDLVIANPPYVGEKGHKAMFDTLKTTSLGRRFYKGKMDLFYFFFHLGLDILHENGILTFISTNYYLTATNADKLRADYKARATPLRFINFHELKIFESAIGQHNLITQLQKGKHDIDCQTIITARKGYPGDSSSIIPKILSGEDENTEYYNISQSNIYNSRGFLDLKDNPVNALMENITLKHPRVKDYYKVSKGLETGDNKVFVFDASRPDFYKKLSEAERQYIRPFFKNSDVKKYTTNPRPTKSVLYIDKDFVPEYNPQISQYLEKYHDDLAGRAQIKRSNQAWYTLLWPRDERMFTGDKIVFPYRAKTNIFSLVRDEWFSGTDTYFVYDSSKRKLELCLALLNSKLALVWLKNKGAVKGDVLELKGDVVADFPIPKPTQDTSALESQIVRITTEIIDTSRSSEELEAKLNTLIYELYALTTEEIAIIEEFSK